MSVNEKDVQVLTITRPTPSRQYTDKSVNVLSSIEDVDSTHSLTPTPTTALFHKGTPSVSSRQQSPLSPFRDDSATLIHSDTKNNANVYETDLEACATESKTIYNIKSTPGKHCTVWPGQQALKERKAAMRRARTGFHPLARFSHRNTIIIKILIGLALVAVVVGVSIGVTKAVGGGVWKGNNSPNA